MVAESIVGSEYGRQQADTGKGDIPDFYSDPIYCLEIRVESPSDVETREARIAGIMVVFE